MPSGKSVTTISDEELLNLLHLEYLRVDLDTAEVWVCDKLRKPGIVGTAQRNGTRYRLEICYESRRRTIVRSRLVYLAGSRVPIPEGQELHHLDENRYNDAWDNLVLLSVGDHLKLHRWLQQESGEGPDESQYSDVPF